MARPAFVQSVFDFAIREINALETRIVKSEDEADSMLWEQAGQVVAQLKAGLSQRALAKQWINARTGHAYSQHHVSYVKQVFEKFTSQNPRPPFRDCYNEIANAEPMAVHHSSETPEHYTPAVIIDATIECFEGCIDLDPCSNPGKPNVPALNYFTQAEDGLQQSWAGKVYMNPPYGREIDSWIDKLLLEATSGEVTEAIALVPARPDTRWFSSLREHVCCFVEGRLTFIGNDAPAPFPSAVFYIGPNPDRFFHAFQSIGDIWHRLLPGMCFGE
jgi:hypothetical protein